MSKLTVMFITFEGIDSSGKSTQCRLLYDHLKSEKKKAILVREPGGTVISEKVREILLDKEHNSMEPLTEFLLFSSSRYQLTKEVIIPHLKKKYFVICDRYYDSSTAYQGYGGKVDPGIISRINEIATDNLVPDVTFFINIGIEESIKRNELAGKDIDRFESKTSGGGSYYKRVIDGYLKIAENNKKRFVVIDGCKPEAEIHNIILESINNRSRNRDKTNR
jgi:dTMP kinase